MSEQERFLEAVQHVAFYGLSRKGKGFAYHVLSGLRAHNPQLRVTAVHPDKPLLDGIPVAISAAHAEPRPDSAVIVLSQEKARKALDDVAAGGIHRVWLVLEAASEANLAYAGDLGLEASRGCPLLYIDGLGFPHNVHRWLARVFKTI